MRGVLRALVAQAVKLRRLNIRARQTLQRRALRRGEPFARRGGRIGRVHGKVLLHIAAAAHGRVRELPVTLRLHARVQHRIEQHLRARHREALLPRHKTEHRGKIPARAVSRGGDPRRIDAKGGGVFPKPAVACQSVLVRGGERVPRREPVVRQRDAHAERAGKLSCQSEMVRRCVEHEPAAVEKVHARRLALAARRSIKKHTEAAPIGPRHAQTRYAHPAAALLRGV